MDKEAKEPTKVQRWGYIMIGEVKSLNKFFLVPKGEDTKMVYNETSSELNVALWVPHFALSKELFHPQMGQFT